MYFCRGSKVLGRSAYHPIEAAGEDGPGCCSSSARPVDQVVDVPDVQRVVVPGDVALFADGLDLALVLDDSLEELGLSSTVW